ADSTKPDERRAVGDVPRCDALGESPVGKRVVRRERTGRRETGSVGRRAILQRSQQREDNRSRVQNDMNGP
ncbi:MAG: hypothetical protein AAB093_05940, partial [Nitrospirota bacterium]